MKLTFIGTGSPSSLSNSASLLINDDILIDVGPNIFKTLLNNKDIDLKKIQYILITHFHGDHFFDLPFLLYSLVNAKKDDKKIIIIANYKAKSKIKKLLKLAFPLSYKRELKGLDIKYINCNTIKDYKLSNTIILNSFKVNHGNFTLANAFIFKENKTLIYTGDTSYNSKLKDKIKSTDYVVIDSTMSTGTNSHMGVDNILDLSNNNENLIIMPTHMSPNSKKNLLKNSYINNNVIVKDDGDIIEI